MSSDSTLYPIFVDLHGKKIVVAGGGPVATRKVQALVGTGATVVVIAPEISDDLRAIASASENMTVELRRAEPSDLDDAFLLFAATNDREANAELAQAARARSVLANVADAPGEGDVMVPSTGGSGAVRIAVSTGGGFPSLAAEIRRHVDASLPSGIDALAAILSHMRERLGAASPDETVRRAVIERVSAGGLLSLWEREGAEGVNRRIRDAWTAHGLEWLAES